MNFLSFLLLKFYKLLQNLSIILRNTVCDLSFASKENGSLYAAGAQGKGRGTDYAAGLKLERKSHFIYLNTNILQGTVFVVIFEVVCNICGGGILIM